MGYFVVVYDVVIVRLVWKYGGKRREFIMRLEELDKFCGVCEGNVSDFEYFVELLDIFIVKLCDVG